MTRLLRRLTAALTAVVPSALPGVAAPAPAADDVEIVGHGTVCWEFKRTIDCYVEVVLTEPAPVNVTVGFATADGTATAGEDYEAVTGVAVTVPAGILAVQVPLHILSDKIVEPDEWFWVKISDPSYGEIVGPMDKVTILDGS